MDAFRGNLVGFCSRLESDLEFSARAGDAGGGEDSRGARRGEEEGKAGCFCG